MSEKSAARHAPTAGSERDTLPSVEQQLLRDQLEALLSSHTLHRNDIDRRGAERADADAGTDDSCSEPGADARLLRDAILAAGKSA